LVTVGQNCGRWTNLTCIYERDNAVRDGIVSAVRC